MFLSIWKGAYKMVAMQTATLKIVGVLVFMGLSVVSRANYWKNHLTEEQVALFNALMEPTVQLYRKGLQDEALLALEDACAAAEAQNLGCQFYTRVWCEAQLETGKLDLEWATKIYIFLHEQDIKKFPEHATHIPSCDFILYGNISGALYSQGKAAEGRSWIMRLEDSISEHQNLNTVHPETYADRGALFPYMPEARARDFPIYSHQQKGVALTTDKPVFIHYPLLYGVRYIADEAYYSGDWIRAAELFSWFISYAEAYAIDKNFRNEEVYRGALSVTVKLARICELHGHPEEAVRLFDHFLEYSQTHFPRQKILHASARIKREAAKVKLGTIAEEALAIADDSLEVIANYRYYSVEHIMGYELLRARIYHALGRRSQAWDIVNEQLSVANASRDSLLWTSILTTAIDLAMDDGATEPLLEEWLIMALKNERLRGNKFEELTLYETYARYLALQGRLEEAVIIQREAMRLARISTIKSLEDRMEQAMGDYLSQLHSSTPVELVNNALSASSMAPGAQGGDLRHRSLIPGGVQPSVSSVEIQPATSLTASLPGAPAFGRFYLYNASRAQQQGTFLLRGAVEKPVWLTDCWMMVAADPSLPSSEWTATLRLAPGASHVIDMAALPAKDGSLATIECVWFPDGENNPGARANWDYHESDTQTRTAVIDAHEIQQNPFYLIPVRHMVQRVSSSEEEIADLRIQASETLRIEVYNEADHRLIAVDANGDGDFHDQGDLITHDSNRNSWPDIIFPKGKARASILLYMRPVDTTSEGEIELAVQLMEDGAWQTDAIDTIRFKK